MSSLTTKDAAQRRADQIAAFRAELDALAGEGALPFAPAELEAVAAHQEALLARLSREFDIDRGVDAKRMSIGMRLASLFGAATLTAAVVSFIYRIWGDLPTAGQVTLLTAAPIVPLLVMIAAGRIEKTRYVASLFAIVACAGVVLQTTLLGTLFNMRSTPHMLLVWAVFAFAVALPWRFGVPFAWGVVALCSYAGAVRLWIFRAPWDQFPEALEPVVFTAALVFAAHRLMPRELAAWGRGAALLMAFGPLLVLSWERPFYQVLSLVAGVAVIAGGLRQRWRETTQIGVLFTSLFLLTRFVDWWWDWMPRYLFFLILSSIALAWLLGLRLARRRLTTVLDK